MAEVYEDPDDKYEDAPEHGPDREVRWRRYDGRVAEIVVDRTDGSVVGVEFISPSRGMDLQGVPRAAEIEIEARKIGLPIRLPRRIERAAG